MHKRPGSKNWQITVGGVRQTSSTESKAEAAELERRLNSEAWQRDRLGIVTRTWEELLIDWLKAHATDKGLETQKVYGDFWTKHIRHQSRFTAESLVGILENHRTGRLAPDRTRKIPQNGTANTYLAFACKVIKSGGLIPPKVSYYPEPSPAETWLTVADWWKLVPFLTGGAQLQPKSANSFSYQGQSGGAPDFSDLAWFSLATGLREANVMGLEWAWVKDDKLMIPGSNTKTAVPYSLPLNKTALGVIQRRKDMPVKHVRNVFTMSGKLWHRMAVHRAWKRVQARSGLPHMPYHGLRHTWASWLTNDGVPLPVIERLGHWHPKGGTVNRYAHFDVEYLRPFAERFDSIVAIRSAPAMKDERA